MKLQEKVLSEILQLAPSFELTETYGQIDYFGVKRVLVRSGVLLSVVFVGESVPTFGPVLDLVGGSTLTLTSLVFPCIFYIYLRAAEEKAGEKGAIDVDEPPRLQEVIQRTSSVTLAICAFVILFGVIGGGAATFSAVNELTATHFVPPCYVAPFLPSTESTGDPSRTTNCCGGWQNISLYDNPAKYCTDPELDFYTK
ncbi:Protein Y32F6A.4 [Aphelenchoides avenae]|nr:Protein Y32F6A.4 [Aphelenchus avenae]